MSALPVSLRQAGSCVLPYHRAGMPITGRDQFEKRSSNQLATAKREELRGKKEVIVIVIVVVVAIVIVVERITRMTTDAKLFMAK